MAAPPLCNSVIGNAPRDAAFSTVKLGSVSTSHICCSSISATTVQVDYVIPAQGDSVTFENLNVSSINGCGDMCGDLLVGRGPGVPMGCLPLGAPNSILTARSPTSGVDGCLEWSDSATLNNLHILSQLSFNASYPLGTVLTVNNAGNVVPFDPVGITPGSTLTYTGGGASGLQWTVPSMAGTSCTDNFAISVGRDALDPPACVLPTAGVAGQLLVYDGSTAQQPASSAPTSGVRWGATNAAGASSQLLYYDSINGIPMYNTPAPAGLPSVLTIDATNPANPPTWTTPAGVGQVLQYDGSNITWTNLPGACNDLFSVAVGTGVATTCAAPTLAGQLLAYDGSATQDLTMPNPAAGVRWVASNAITAAGTTSTQLLFFDQTISAPEYLMAPASSSVPSVLVTDPSAAATAADVMPQWVTPAGVGQVLQYDGSNIIWTNLPGSCVDMFSVAVGTGAATTCAAPTIAGQLLAYDGSAIQDATNPNPTSGVHWVASNAITAPGTTSTQLLFFDQTISAPEYLMAPASSTVPSVLVTDPSTAATAADVVPLWVTPAGVGQVLQYDGSNITWTNLPGSCVDMFSVAVGTGLATTCAAPTIAGQLLAYDGSVTQDITTPNPTSGVRWVASNAITAPGTTSTQLLFFDQTISAPEYLMAPASSTVPSVLVTDPSTAATAADVMPQWVTPAGAGQFLQYNGVDIGWVDLPAPCIDAFTVSVGTGSSTTCVAPTMVGQLLAYDGSVTQDVTTPNPTAGVRWVASNATTAAGTTSTQMMFFDQATLAPEYMVTAANPTVPSVLITDASSSLAPGDVMPIWATPGGAGQLLQYTGTTIDWVTLPVPCTDVFTVTVGTGADVTCAAPTKFGQFLAYDGSATQDTTTPNPTAGVHWVASNAVNTAGSTSTQVVYFDQTTNSPEYMVTPASSTTPAVLVTDPAATATAADVVPQWITPTTIYDSLIYDGTNLVFGYSGLQQYFSANTEGLATGVDISPDPGVAPGFNTVTFNAGTVLNNAPATYTAFDGSTLTINTVGHYVFFIAVCYIRGAGSTSSTSSLLRIRQNGVDISTGYVTAGVPSAGSAGSASFPVRVNVTTVPSTFTLIGSRGNSGGGGTQTLLTGTAFTAIGVLPATAPCTMNVVRIS